MDTAFLIVASILLLSAGFAVYFALRYQKVKAELNLAEYAGRIESETAAAERAHRQAIEAARAKELRETYQAAIAAAKTKGPDRALSELHAALDKIKKARKQ